MAKVLDRVPPVEKITAEARQIHFGRTVLTAIAGVLFSIGWTFGMIVKAVRGVWMVFVAWPYAAIKVGWKEARRPRPR